MSIALKFFIVSIVMPVLANENKCIDDSFFTWGVNASSVKEFFNSPKVKASKDPIDELICCLPKYMRTNPPYVYQTRSPQSATRKRPRVLLASNSGAPIIAFSGNSPVVEIIEQDSLVVNDGIYTTKHNQLSFHSFKPGKEGAGENQNQQCASCHNGHYNWDTYFVWPGLYGADDGILPKHDEQPWKDFISESPNLPRYRCLIESGVIGTRNFYFGKKLFKENVKRVATLLNDSKKLLPFRATLMGYTLCSDQGNNSSFKDPAEVKAFSNIESFLPTDLMKKVPKGQTYQDYRSWLDEEEDKYARQKLARLKELNANQEPTTRAASLYKDLSSDPQKKLSTEKDREKDLKSGFLMITKGLAKDDTMDNWSLVFKGKSISFNTGQPEDYFTREVMEHLAGEWLPELGIQYSGKTTPELCKELQKVSKATLSRLVAPENTNQGGIKPLPTH